MCERWTGSKLSCGCFNSNLCDIQLLSQNLRGEMIAHLEGAKLTLSDSRFIQVIAKSLSISCKEVRLQDLFGFKSYFFLRTLKP